MAGGEVVITRTKAGGRLAASLIAISTLLLIWTVWTSARDETFTTTDTVQTIAVSLGLVLFGIPALRAARRARVTIAPPYVELTNGYYVHKFPIETTEVVFTEVPVDEYEGRDVRTSGEQIPMGRRMFLKDAERMVHIDASLGLVPNDFDKLAEDIRRAIIDSRSRPGAP